MGEDLFQPLKGRQRRMGMFLNQVNISSISFINLSFFKKKMRHFTVINFFKLKNNNLGILATLLRICFIFPPENHGLLLLKEIMFARLALNDKVILSLPPSPLPPPPLVMNNKSKISLYKAERCWGERLFSVVSQGLACTDGKFSGMWQIYMQQGFVAMGRGEAHLHCHIKEIFPLCKNRITPPLQSLSFRSEALK